MRKLFIVGLVMAAVGASAAIAQTTSPGRQQPSPQVQAPPVQMRAPNVATPNRALPRAPIPVYIIGDRSRRRTIEIPAGAALIGTRYAERDHDRDGRDHVSYGGDDCDDNDPARNPRQVEVADQEGKDEDCNYETIGGLDDDADGFVSWLAMNFVRDQMGVPLLVIRGPDCHDGRPDINPNAPEIPGDNLDNNCDGLIDRFPSGGGAYCAPTDRTSVPLQPCGMPQGGRE
jgi:hypothetical protein